MKPQHYHHAMPAPDACIDQCDGQYMKLIALAQCSCAVGVGGGSATRPNSQYKKSFFILFLILSITRSTAIYMVELRCTSQYQVNVRRQKVKKEGVMIRPLKIIIVLNGVNFIKAIALF